MIHQNYSTLLLVEWSHCGYVTSCFIYSMVAVVWDRGLGWRLLPASGREMCLLWCDSFLLCLGFGVWCLNLISCHPRSQPPCVSDICKRAVSCWLWQVAVWNPPVLLTVCCDVLQLFAGEMSDAHTTQRIMVSLFVVLCPLLTLQAFEICLTYFQLYDVKFLPVEYRATPSPFT